MNNLRIIVISQWFHPEPGPRVHELGAELVSRGHKVTVLTGFPSYPYNHFYDGWRPKCYKRENYKGVDVLRLPHFPHSQKSVFKRILNYSSFMASVASIGNALIRKADCMYVFLPPPLMGLAASSISLFHGIPFIYDIQDIWPEAAVGSGMVNNKFFMSSLRALEKVVYPLARAITVPSEGYRQNLVGKGVSPAKIKVIPNWVDESLYNPMVYDEALASKYNIRGKFVVTFAGNMGQSQALQTVIEAARILSKETNIRFLLAGDGLAWEGLKELSGRYNLENVIFTGRLPVEEMSSLFSISDMLLIHLKNDPIFKMTIPSKTQAYMACGKPILMAVEGDAAQLIESTGSGITCHQEDPSAMAKTVLDVYKMLPEERAKMGENARAAFLEHFRKSDVIGKYEDLLRRISSK